MSEQEREKEDGRCRGCKSADYTQVCDRGKPRYGPAGLYCEPCHREADMGPFGESPYDRLP